MKKYFLHDGKNQLGPFSIEELEEKSISKDTYIWFEGLKDWEKAGEVEELKKLFKNSPPPFSNSYNEESKVPPSFNTGNKNGNNNSVNTDEMPVVIRKKKSSASIVAMVVLGIVFISLFAVYKNKSKGGEYDAPYESTYEEKVKTVEEIERENPQRFLNASGTYNENVWGTKFRMEGVITNTATVATYKDVVIEVVFYTSTKTELKRERYTIYEILSPTSTKNFKLKVGKPKACTSIGWDAVSALAY